MSQGIIDVRTSLHGFWAKMGVRSKALFGRRLRSMHCHDFEHTEEVPGALMRFIFCIIDDSGRAPRAFRVRTRATFSHDSGDGTGQWSNRSAITGMRLSHSTTRLGGKEPHQRTIRDHDKSISEQYIHESCALCTSMKLSKMGTLSCLILPITAWGQPLYTGHEASPDFFQPTSFWVFASIIAHALTIDSAARNIRNLRNAGQRDVPVLSTCTNLNRCFYE